MTGDSQPEIDGPISDRRTVLKLGVGVAGTAVGVGGLAGAAAAWNRFDVDFRDEREVWFVVGNYLKYEPPAVAHVLVADDDAVRCEGVEFTRDNATSVPHADGTHVVSYEADGGETIVGVLGYNRSPDTDDRFDRPRCVLRSDAVDVSAMDVSLAEAECVEAAVQDHWDGRHRSCWWEPVDVGGFDLVQRQRFSPQAADSVTTFGKSVAVSASGRTILVGAPSPSPRPGNRGTVYVFTRLHDGSVHTETFSNGGHYFGSEVAVNAAGNLALVGAWGGDTSASETRGLAYLYGQTGTDWHRLTRVLPANGENGQFFGSAVDMTASGRVSVVGARGAEDRGRADTGEVTGAAFVFELD